MALDDSISDDWEFEQLMDLYKNEPPSSDGYEKFIFYKGLKFLNDKIINLENKLESIEKNINGMSDDINIAFLKTGCEIDIRQGKRHHYDIIRIIEFFLKFDVGAKADLIYSRIENALMANDKIESPYEFSEDLRVPIQKDNVKYEKYIKWQNKAKPRWIEIIEAERDSIKRALDKEKK